MTRPDQEKAAGPLEPTANVAVSIESPAEHAAGHKGILEQRDVIRALFVPHQLEEARRVSLMDPIFGAGGAGLLNPFCQSWSGFHSCDEMDGIADRPRGG